MKYIQRTTSDLQPPIMLARESRDGARRDAGYWTLGKCKFRLGFAVLLLALAGSSIAFAQSNNIPGPTDYAAFSRFIAERNIFDPNRAPRNGRPRYRPQHVSRTAPMFTLVGTMSYAKGLFAFFDGNQPDLRKVLYERDSNSIAGFSVAHITLSGVTLQSAGKKQTVELKIGDSMREEDNAWRRVAAGELPAVASATEDEAAANEADSNADANAAPPSSGEANDILKKLMQQREQELK